MRTLSIRLVPGAAHAELTFRYDDEIVNVIRALRERRWHPERRRWTVARSEIDNLCRELERRGVHVTVHGAAAARTADGALVAGRDADAASGGHTRGGGKNDRRRRHDPAGAVGSSRSRAGARRSSGRRSRN